MPLTLYAARFGPACLTPSCGAQHALLSVAVGAMNNTINNKFAIL